MVNWSTGAILRLAAVLCAAFALGWYGSLYEHDVREKQCASTYSLINAEIVCEDHGRVISKANYTKLMAALEAYIDKQKTEGHVSHVSVYFRDLVNGPVMGIDEMEDFAPASLLKVPLALVYMNREDNQPGFLASLPPMQTIAATSTQVRSVEDKLKNPTLKNLNQRYKPVDPIQSGINYGVEDLLFRMLAHSDNMALELLASYVNDRMGGVAEVHKIFNDLGLVEGSSLTEETISVRGYASIFRTLYHATYLNADLSQKMMQWLAQSSFDDGLEAGVPEGVVVAHKFGERDWSATNTHQLHDCGVVYYPGNPYLLCVMTQGPSSDALASVIATISRMTYDEVKSRAVMP